MNDPLVGINTFLREILVGELLRFTPAQFFEVSHDPLYYLRKNLPMLQYIIRRSFRVSSRYLNSFQYFYQPLTVTIFKRLVILVK